jgi:hypothetical protein
VDRQNYWAIGGWLILPALALLAAPAWTVYRIYLPFSDGAPKACLTQYVLLNSAFLVCSVYVGVEFFRRARAAPYLVIALILTHAGHLFFGWMCAEVILFEGYGADIVGRMWWNGIRSGILWQGLAVIDPVVTLAGVVVGIPYFLRSKRVKATFVN